MPHCSVDDLKNKINGFYFYYFFFQPNKEKKESSNTIAFKTI